MYRRKKETALERLAARYRRFSRFGLAMMIVSTLWSFSNLPFSDPGMKYLVTILFILYFGTCSLIDNRLYHGVASIDCFTMSVSEVISKALYYRKKHLQSMILLIPFAFLVLGILAYSCISDPSIIYGMVTGFIIGVVIGLIQFFKFMAEYRAISEA